MREPEYDDYTQSRSLALTVWEAGWCPSCGNYDSLVPQGGVDLTVATPDGRTFEVVVYRCLSCGIEEVGRREWGKKHANDQPNGTGALASDGLKFVARPRSKEV